jgi:hypothetical protein
MVCIYNIFILYTTVFCMREISEKERVERERDREQVHFCIMVFAIHNKATTITS